MVARLYSGKKVDIPGFVVVKMPLCYQQEQDVRKRYTMFNFIIGLFLTIISVFGLVGNIVAIIVLSRPTMKGSFSSLLIGKSYF